MQRSDWHRVVGDTLPAVRFLWQWAASQEHTQRRCKKTPSVFRPHLSGGDTKQGRHLENHTRHDPVGCTLGMSVGSPGLAKAGSSTMKVLVWSWVLAEGAQKQAGFFAGVRPKIGARAPSSAESCGTRLLQVGGLGWRRNSLLK